MIRAISYKEFRSCIDYYSWFCTNRCIFIVKGCKPQPLSHFPLPDFLGPHRLFPTYPLFCISLYYSRCPFLVVDSRFSFLILHSLYSRPAVPMLCVPSKVDVSPWPFLWSVNLIVSEMKKADLRMGRKRNLSRQKDLEVPEDPTIPECTCSQNSLPATGVTCDGEYAIDLPSFQFSKRAD